MGAGIEFASERHAIIETYTRKLRRVLRNCSARELEILTRFYACGQDPARVAREMNCTVEEVNRLRRRVRQAVVAARPAAKAAAAAR